MCIDANSYGLRRVCSHILGSLDSVLGNMMDDLEKENPSVVPGELNEWKKNLTIYENAIIKNNMAPLYDLFTTTSSMLKELAKKLKPPHQGEDLGKTVTFIAGQFSRLAATLKTNRGGLPIIDESLKMATYQISAVAKAMKTTNQKPK